MLSRRSFTERRNGQMRPRARLQGSIWHRRCIPQPDRKEFFGYNRSETLRTE